MTSGTKMQDLNPVAHQTKATFTPASSVPPRPPVIAVQRVARPQPNASNEPDPLLAELAAEFGSAKEGSTGEPVQATAAETGQEFDTDVDTILKRFKGTPEEVTKQLAKSYAESEKRMRRLEQEKTLLVQHGTQQATVTPTVQPQVKVVPTFDYKKWGDTFLDKPDERVKELEAHLQAQSEQAMLAVAGPLYEEAIDNRLFRKFGHLVTEDNLDLIKAMAQNEPGTNRWEKTVSAVKKYEAAMPHAINTANADVATMVQAVQTPAPQARTSGHKKMWKESELRTLMHTKMRTGEYQRDLLTRNLIDAAYRDGRVLRGE